MRKSPLSNQRPEQRAAANPARKRSPLTRPKNLTIPASPPSLKRRSARPHRNPTRSNSHASRPPRRNGEPKAIDDADDPTSAAHLRLHLHAGTGSLRRGGFAARNQPGH